MRHPYYPAHASPTLPQSHDILPNVSHPETPRNAPPPASTQSVSAGNLLFILPS